MASFLDKIFGTHSKRELKKIKPILDSVISLEEEYKSLSNDDLRAKTNEFRERLKNNETLDDILPEAFATVRESSDRVLGMRHYPVQIIGGIVLHQGRIAEMRTGEGKTLVSTLPAYLNALTGNGVHIVTANDYLAKRDSEWMGKIHRFLGLTVGLVIHDTDPMYRKESYACDITYGTNNEFGFDYLRDNMAIYEEAMVQRNHQFAIIDEVDSILIDEARTPLIISGQGDKSTVLYRLADDFAKNLKALRLKEVDEKEEREDLEYDYIVDEKAKSATLTPKGQKWAEGYFNIENISDPDNSTLLHHINQAIKARSLMFRDIDYVVKDGKVIIVDEYTGRLMFGRRYSEGLHQAIEAKENVKVERESKTLATITFQNYFRLYTKLSGMTGTAITEEDEFRHIYKLDVIEIPTNNPPMREDLPDRVYKNINGKMKSIVGIVKECHEKGQPILVGTVSIEDSEKISKSLKMNGIPHNVLNAKQHEKEAEIIAQAGHLGAVTIATNMAGRGTDILLGGNPEYLTINKMRQMGYSDEIINEANGHGETSDEGILEARAKFEELLQGYKLESREDAEKVKEAGGLFILGTERHESRRIDNQLRGRAGRQGDPGSSVFLISLEDDLMRLFGSARIGSLLDNLGLEEDEPIDQKILSNAIESAQRKVEGRNFSSRKHVLEYDDVMNKQRQVIYAQRLKVLKGENIKENVVSMLCEFIEGVVNSKLVDKKYIEQEDIQSIKSNFTDIFLTEDSLQFSSDELDELTSEALCNIIKDIAIKSYDEREAQTGSEAMRELERVVLLRNVDEKWMEHIDCMQELRHGIGLRAYAQHDPVIEYKREGFDMFDQMIAQIKEDTIKMIFNLRLTNNNAPQREKVAIETGTSSDDSIKSKPIKKESKPGGNDACSCGSGKKYKKCCGAQPK